VIGAVQRLEVAQKNLVQSREKIIRPKVRAFTSAPRRAASSSAAKPKLTEHQKRQAIRRRDHDGEPVREIARSYNVSHSTISRLLV
jgi:DNA-binding NarL/FixJ family response regulator